MNFKRETQLCLSQKGNLCPTPTFRRRDLCPSYKVENRFTSSTSESPLIETTSLIVKHVRNKISTDRLGDLRLTDLPSPKLSQNRRRTVGRVTPRHSTSLTPLLEGTVLTAVVDGPSTPRQPKEGPMEEHLTPSLTRGKSQRSCLNPKLERVQ